MRKLIKQIKSRNLFKRVQSIFVELVIVFVGVYAAFSLDRWNDKRAAEQQREQILLALLQNLEVYIDELREESSEFETTHFAPFMEAYENDEMPFPDAIPMGGSGLNSDFWSAMLQAVGLEVLEIETISQIETYYTVLRFAVGRITTFDGAMTAQLVPNLDSGLEEFYNLEDKRLLKRYEWYPRMLSETNRQLQRISVAADALKTVLEAELGEGI